MVNLKIPQSNYTMEQTCRSPDQAGSQTQHLQNKEMKQNTLNQTLHPKPCVGSLCRFQGIGQAPKSPNPYTRKPGLESGCFGILFAFRVVLGRGTTTSASPAPDKVNPKFWQGQRTHQQLWHSCRATLAGTADDGLQTSLAGDPRDR